MMIMKEWFPEWFIYTLMILGGFTVLVLGTAIEAAISKKKESDVEGGQYWARF